jgi:hypothetical protein
MNRSSIAVLSLGLATVLAAGCNGDGTAGSGGAGGSSAPPLGCDPLTPTYCGFPYPNDYWTVPDPSTVTGLRLALPEVTMPPNRSGARSNPDAFNEMDGFS